MADDPTWTANQVAAVHAVDAYYEVESTIWKDPANADLLLLPSVVTDPQYTKDLDAFLWMASVDRRITGTVIPVARTVSPETVVSGRPEITVWQCQEDEPGGEVIEKGATLPAGNPRVEYMFAVQWVEEDQRWLVAHQERTKDIC
ncbi:MAG: hypothetical protein LBL92_00205 [Propionibacteriaceae bacterium]|nr:hypothetical protein [Propionibacteriaceae bacterium]